MGREGANEAIRECMGRWQCGEERTSIKSDLLEAEIDSVYRRKAYITNLHEMPTST